MKALLLAMVLIIVSCTQKKKFSDETKKETKMESSTEIKNVKPTDLKTGPDLSTPVISNAQKFIIPVPAFKGGGEPLIYPENNTNSGKPILDYEGKAIGKQGVVFFNYKDKSLQAAPGDGKSVIIINEVTDKQAETLDKEIRKLKADPNDLTLKEFKQILEFAHTKLNLSDMYNSTRSFIKEKMTSVLPDKDSKNGRITDEAYGFKKRDDRDINQAIYIPGEFVFEGPAASPQVFKNGGVIIEQEGKMRGVQPEIFLRTYRFADGKEIPSVESLHEQMKL